MVGNLSNLKSFSKSSFQESGWSLRLVVFFNDKEDQRNKGLDLAYSNELTKNIGTKNGFASETLGVADGDDIRTFITKQGVNLSSTLNDEFN